LGRAFILLGSNSGDCKANLGLAIQKISDSCGSIVTISSIYETAPWGVENQQNYLNQVVEIETKYFPFGLLKALQQIEQSMGRTNKGDMLPRTIDLDILLMDAWQIASDQLIIPHPRMAERRFCLIPLCEIAATTIHPTTKKSIHEMLDSCEDTLEVIKLHS
jgi:2-amino-4-hydroxy-6-hydroxymethyldihydropteridine diphosphokinase